MVLANLLNLEEENNMYKLDIAKPSAALYRSRDSKINNVNYIEKVHTYIIFVFTSSKLSATKYTGWSPFSGYFWTIASEMSNSLCSGSSVTQY